MKRFIIIILVALSWLPLAAQLNGTGYYRVRNVANDTHYITLANDKIDFAKVVSDAGGGGTNCVTGNGKTYALGCVSAYITTDIHLIEDADCVNPASLIYLKRNGNTPKYDLIGQSTSLIKLTTGIYDSSAGPVTFSDNYAVITETLSGSQKYTAKIELKASIKMIFTFSQTFGTIYFFDNDGTFGIGDSGDNDNAQWYIEPVDSFNVDTSSLVEYKGKYYCTMYTPFAYKLSGQTLKAWVITGIDNSDGTLTKEVVANNGETVPAGTPVILECGSNELGACTLEPQGEPRTDNASAYIGIGTNLLKGAYFCNTDGNISYDKSNGGTGTIAANNYTSYSASTMLVLGVAESPTGVSRLGFFPYTGNKMKSNKVWLDISGSSANANFTFDTDEPNQKGVAHE